MKFKNTNITEGKIILVNDHYVAIPFDCSNITADADGIIKAGTVIPANDNTAIGVLFTDVYKSQNSNGTIVIHGFIKEDKLPTAPDSSAKEALKQVSFI